MLAVFNCAISWNRKIASQVIMFILFIKNVTKCVPELVNVELCTLRYPVTFRLQD